MERVFYLAAQCVGVKKVYSVCVCVFSSHSFWTSSLLDVPAGVTEEEGHTGFFIHLPSAVCALIFLATDRGFLKKNQNAPRPSEHPPVREEKMSERLGGIKGCKYKTSSWHSAVSVNHIYVIGINEGLFDEETISISHPPESVIVISRKF